MSSLAAPDLATAQQANADGVAALQADRPHDAIAAFRRAATADPAVQPLWFNLAHACRLTGDAGGERAALEASLALDRTDLGTQLRMAQLLQRLGDEQGALQASWGVQQLAAARSDLAPGIAAEIAAGQSWCEKLQVRIGEWVDSCLAEIGPKLDETEARRVRAFMDRALGRRAIYHNECAGLLYPFLPEDEFFDFRHFPWLAELAALLAAPDESLRPYVRMEEGTPPNRWSPLDHSLDWGACFLWEYGAPNQPVLDRCPQTAALLARLPMAIIPGRAPNAFFSVLRPHAHIPPHTGVTNTRAIIHLALEVPPGCSFRVGGETREWVEGKAFAFDDTIDHEAWNNSDRRRAVLIFDTWNPHLSEGERSAIVRYHVETDAVLGQGVA